MSGRIGCIGWLIRLYGLRRLFGYVCWRIVLVRCSLLLITNRVRADDRWGHEVVLRLGVEPICRFVSNDPLRTWPLIAVASGECITLLRRIAVVAVIPLRVVALIAVTGISTGSVLPKPVVVAPVPAVT